MIVDSDRKDFFGTHLANYILIKNRIDFFGFRQFFTGGLSVSVLNLFRDNVITKVYTFVTDKHRRTCNQLANFVLTLAAERTVQQLAVIFPFSGFLITHNTVSTNLLIFNRQGRIKFFYIKQIKHIFSFEKTNDSRDVCPAPGQSCHIFVTPRHS